MLKFLRDNKSTNSMYSRYIPELHREGSGRSILCGACMDWSCEKPFSKILSDNRYNGDNATENIDSMIDLLQHVVSFNVPLLLKPIFDMFSPKSVFLLCMQTGAYKPFTRRMIEIGIPRETAIYLSSNLFSSKKTDMQDAAEIEKEIRKEVSENYEYIPYWIKVQLDFIV